MAEGLKKIEALRFAGYTEAEISDWKNKRSETLAAGGFSTDEVKSYFGDTDPDTTAMKQYVDTNIQKVASEQAANPDKPIEAKGYLEAIEAGWDMSVSGLMTGKPDVILPENADRAMRITSQIATLVGDIPAMAVGGMLGGIGGAGAGGAVGNLPGVPVGLALGTGAGAFALPAGLRKIMMDHYEKGDIKSAGEFMDRLSSTTWEMLKQGTVGAATFGLGKAAGVGAEAVGIGSRGKAFTEVAAEIGTMTTVGAAVEGHLPNADHFIDAAIVVGGIRGVGLAASKLRTMYAEKGVRPEEVVEMTKTDPVLKQEILSLPKPKFEGKTLDLKIEQKPFSPIEEALFKDQIKYEAPKIIETVNPEKVQLFDPSKTRTEAELKVLSRLGEQAVPETLGVKDTLVKMYKDFTNDLHPINEFVRELSTGKVPAEQNPVVLSQTYRGWHGAVERALKFGTFKFRDMATQTGEGLISILKDVPNNDKDGLTAYGMAKRAIEKEAQGVQTGIDLAAAKEVVAQGTHFENTFRRLVDFNNRMMDYAVESGLISEKSSKQMKAMNKDFFPFHRIMEVDPFEAGGKGKGLFKNMKGSERQIQDPITTSYKNMIAIIRASERNRVYGSLVDMALKSEKGNEFLQLVKKELKPINVKDVEVAKMLDELGVDPNIAAESFTIFRAKDHLLKDNEFIHYDEGKAQVFKVKPEMAEALNALDVHSGVTNLFTRIARGFAQTLRFSVVSTPDFALKNLFRDQFTAGVQSKYGQIPFYDVLTSVGHIWKQDKVWQDYLSSGASSGSFGEIIQYIEKDVWELNKKTGFMNSVQNVLKSPLQALGAASQAAEQVTRLAEFKRAGGGKAGAVAAREVTVDFSKGSARSRAINAFVPFFNVGVVSLDKTLNTFSKENIAGTMTKGAAMITVPTMLLWWANRDDSRYKDAPRWQKDLFWIIPTDKWEKAQRIEDALSRPEDMRRKLPDGTWEVNNGTVYRMPKPFIHGMIFGTLVEKVLDSFYQENARAFDGFDETIQQALSVSFTPTAILPVLEQRFNESFFTQKPIVPHHLEDVSPEYQYGEYTSETAKQLGKLIGYVPFIKDLGPESAKLSSPMVIDNYIKSWGGTLGQYAVDIADKGLTAAGIAETKAEKPASTLADIPFIRAFVVRHPSMQMQSIQDFYTKFDETEKIRNSFRKLTKEGKYDEAMELSNNNPDGMINLAGIRKTLYNHNVLIHKINTSKDYSREDKRQLIDSLYFRMSQLANEGNKIFKQLEEKK